MLVSFSAKNFMSYRDAAVLDMRAVESDDSLKDNLSFVTLNRPSGQPLCLLKSAAIYGPNASGKTNFLVALKRFCSFICSRSDRDKEGNIPFAPFRLDPSFREQPSEFEIKLLLNGTLYRYGLAADNKQVYGEWLYAADRGQERFIFRRVFDRSKGIDVLDVGPTGKGFKDIFEKSRVTNSIAMLTVANQLNEKVACIVYSAISKIRPATINQEVDEKVLPLLTLLLRHFDIGIHSIKKINSNIEALKSFIAIDVNEVPDGEKEKVIAVQAALESILEIARNRKELVFSYIDTEGMPVDISQVEQSQGTLHLIGLMSMIINNYKSGGVIICDEVEDSLHPSLCEAFFDLLHKLPYSKTQFICTTHCSTLLNEDVFRRDQVWIVEKDRDGGSQLCCISDYKGTRKKARLGKQYLEGRFGGLPILDPRPLQQFMQQIALVNDEEGHG